jgi:hypothetical protein
MPGHVRARKRRDVREPGNRLLSAPARAQYFEGRQPTIGGSTSRHAAYRGVAGR